MILLNNNKDGNSGCYDDLCQSLVDLIDILNRYPIVLYSFA